MTRLLAMTLIVAGMTAPVAHAAGAVARPPLPAGIPIVQAPCPVAPDAAGCFFNLTIYTDGDRRTRTHEEGHAVDLEYLDDGERHRFDTLAGITAPWYLPVGNREQGSEQFADAYSHCRQGDTPGGHRVRGGGVRFSWWQSTPFHPEVGPYLRICRFIVRAMTDVSGVTDSEGVS